VLDRDGALLGGTRGFLVDSRHEHVVLEQVAHLKREGLGLGAGGQVGARGEGRGARGEGRGARSRGARSRRGEALPGAARTVHMLTMLVIVGGTAITATCSRPPRGDGAPLLWFGVGGTTYRVPPLLPLSPLRCWPLLPLGGRDDEPAPTPPLCRIRSERRFWSSASSVAWGGLVWGGVGWCGGEGEARGSRLEGLKACGLRLAACGLR